MFRSLFSVLKFLLGNWRQLHNLQANALQDSLILSLQTDTPSETDALLRSLEKDIDTFWRTVPFHTLFLNYAMPIEHSPHGGTCSDRAILFHEQLQKKYGVKLKSRLHRASINGRKTHTVILVQIDAKDYLIDVGANWPVMHPIPCFEASKFCDFGIWFWAQPSGPHLRIEMQRPDQEEYHPFLEVDLTPQPPKLVAELIAARHCVQNELPFANGLRFSCVHGDAFYALRGNHVSESPEHPKAQWIAYRDSTGEQYT